MRELPNQKLEYQQNNIGPTDFLKLVKNICARWNHTGITLHYFEWTLLSLQSLLFAQVGLHPPFMHQWAKNATDLLQVVNFTSLFQLGNNLSFADLQTIVREPVTSFGNELAISLFATGNCLVDQVVTRC